MIGDLVTSMEVSCRLAHNIKNRRTKKLGWLRGRVSSYRLAVLSFHGILAYALLFFDYYCEYCWDIDIVL
jgi:hypothetical protein